VVTRALLLVASALLAAAMPASGEDKPDARLSMQTDAVAPERFVAAHGERALLMGYSGAGLEAWAYPIQLFRNYRVSFLAGGSDEAIPGVKILRRIVYRPEEIVRIYVGPDFEVREHLFVPLNKPGVVLTYEVEGRREVRIEVSFLPVLNLMWPGGIGGQDLRWNSDLGAYEIAEITTGYRAIIGSPQQIAHSEVVNSTHRTDLTQSMVLEPAHHEAQIFAALEQKPEPEGAEFRLVEQQYPALLRAAEDHVESLVSSGMSIHTPDEAVNRALLWSKIDLDQSWVCNPQLGCGLIAGYGPSRGLRRPQYAWFFAGDGLVAAEALLADGETARARDELAFIFRYQNHTNGMIWHELSQSAGLIDWKGKYPYMYVHVDITFAFLGTLADYYRATADLEFVRTHWDAIRSAWEYCRALVNPATGLPQIPLGKEGGNEQERMREDVGLSAAWVSAAEAYRQLAEATGHSAGAASAAQAGARARQELAARYWDNNKQFWIAGYSETDKPMTDERSHPGLLGHGLFTAEQEDAALDRLASADFQTDWGTRGMSAESLGFNPDSYASGSVSALGTADVAEAFWNDHRPAIGWSVWQSLIPWLHLDSLGHLHEVAAGDFFHPQVESVPEQTWSSASLLSSAIHGLLGIRIDAPDHRLTLAPHLDPRWDTVSITAIAVGPARVNVAFDQKQGEFDSALSAQDETVHVIFAPQIPLGAHDVSATVDGRPAQVVVERHEEDEHARVELDVHGSPTQCVIRYSGGVRIVPPAPSPAVGGDSRQIKLTGLTLSRDVLTLDADVKDAADSTVDLQTPWTVEGATGGSANPLGSGWYRLSFALSSQQQRQFVHRRMTVRLRSH
jgi:glycogen debranching enzyme